MSDTATATPVRARRGRPLAEQPAPVIAEHAPAADVVADADDTPQAPRVRKPFGSRRQKLDSSERPGFHRHWFNDWPGRIQQALEAGYTHVKGADGKPMSRTVGAGESGSGMTSYRMEIPLEWYNEDQAAKESKRKALMDQIKRGNIAGRVAGEDGAYEPMNKTGTTGVQIK